MSNAAATPAEDLDVEEIPLPPEHIAAEMIAEEDARAAAAVDGKPAAALKKAAKPEPEIAALNFVDGDRRRRTVPLDYPFELEGVVVADIQVRRLNGFEVAAFAREHLQDDGEYDRYELYATMTGLPAPVLRGLDQDDGLKVAGACSAFLSLALTGGS